MITLYSMPSSGNSYKVRLLLAFLGVPYRHVDAEYGSGLTETPEFRTLNPAGKVPLLVLDDGRLLLFAGDDRWKQMAWFYSEHPGFQPSWLLTSLLDPQAFPAEEGFLEGQPWYQSDHSLFIQNGISVRTS